MKNLHVLIGKGLARCTFLQSECELLIETTKQTPEFPKDATEPTLSAPATAARSICAVVPAHHERRGASARLPRNSAGRDQSFRLLIPR